MSNIRERAKGGLPHNKNIFVLPTLYYTDSIYYCRKLEKSR